MGQRRRSSHPGFGSGGGRPRVDTASTPTRGGARAASLVAKAVPNARGGKPWGQQIDENQAEEKSAAHPFEQRDEWQAHESRALAAGRPARARGTCVRSGDPRLIRTLTVDPVSSTSPPRCSPSAGSPTAACLATTRGRRTGPRSHRPVGKESHDRHLSHHAWPNATMWPPREEPPRHSQPAPAPALALPRDPALTPYPTLAANPTPAQN